jgi:integrase
VSDVRVYLKKYPKTLRSGKRVEYYVLRWHGTDGKDYSESLGRVGRITKNEAETRRREKEASLLIGQSPRDKPKPITLDDWIARDVEEGRTHLSLRSLESIREAGKITALAIGGGTRLDRITRDDVARVRRHILEERGCSVTTADKHVRHMRASLNRAVDAGLIHKNPFARPRLGRTTSRPKRIFTEEECWAMRQVAPDPWWHLFLLLAESTGFRLGEILNLTWADVDINDKIIRIAPKRRRAIPGHASLDYLPWEPKSYTQRSVPIPEQLTACLRSWRHQTDGSPYVFLDLRRVRRANQRLDSGPDQPLNLASNIACRFKRIQRAAHALLAKLQGCDLAEVPWELGTPHDLRRTYGTRLARSGTPIHVLKEFMGHSSITTTQEFYLASNSQDADRLRRVLAQQLDAGNSFRASNPSRNTERHL